jgi:hypothetical protein
VKYSLLGVIIFALLWADILINPSVAWSNAETATSELTSGRPAQPATRSNATVDCPPTLKSWIEDDLTDKNSFFFEYKSEVAACQGPIEGFQKYLATKGDTSNFRDHSELNSYLSNRFKDRINPIFETYLSKCSGFSDGQKKLAQVRLYNAARKYEAVNSLVLDQISYIDSVLPRSTPFLDRIDCTSGSWPEIKRKCEELKKAATTCEKERTSRLSDLVKKTQEKIPQIEKLISFYQKCLQGDLNYNEPQLSEPKPLHNPGLPRPKSYYKGAAEETGEAKEKCEPLASAIELLKNDIPWIRGEEFQKIAVKVKPSRGHGYFNTGYDLSTESVTNAISKQLIANRGALENGYNSNLSDFNCLISQKSSDSKCKFEEIRGRLNDQPDLIDIGSTQNTIKDREANSFFEAEKCILERHEDRHETQRLVDRMAFDAILTIGTFGIGEAISAIRLGGAVSNYSILRHPLLYLGGSIQFSTVAMAAETTRSACSNQHRKVIELVKTANLAKENVCSSNQSPLEQAKEAANNCAIVALLSAPAIVAMPGLGRALGAFIAPLKNLKIAEPNNGENGVTLVFWDSQGHFDLLANGRLYGTNPKIPSGRALSEREFEMMAKVIPNASTKRFKISVSPDELKQIEASAIKFSAEYREMLKMSSSERLKYGFKVIWSGNGALCSGVVCGLVGDATGYYVPRVIREFPHLVSAYLKARKMMGDSRLLSIETSGKFNPSAYLKSRDMKDNVTFLTSVTGTYLVIKYMTKNGDVKEAAVEIEIPNNTDDSPIPK